MVTKLPFPISETSVRKRDTLQLPKTDDIIWMVTLSVITLSWAYCINMSYKFERAEILNKSWLLKLPAFDGRFSVEEQVVKNIENHGVLKEKIENTILK